MRNKYYEAFNEFKHACCEKFLAMAKQQQLQLCSLIIENF